MRKKAAVSFPMVIVASIIIMLFVVVIYFLFLNNTENSLLNVFKDVTKQITLFVSGFFGPLG